MMQRNFLISILTGWFLIDFSALADVFPDREPGRFDDSPNNMLLAALRGTDGVIEDSTRAESETAPDSNDDRPISFEINYTYRSGGEGPLMPLTNGAILRSGDHYKIQFTPLQDSYVYIFQMDSNGAVFQLFPMSTFKGVAVDNVNPVQAGATYYLPARDKSFQLDEQRGAESIYFLAFKEPNKEMEERYQRLLKAQKENDIYLIDAARNAIVKDFRTRGLAAIVADSADTTKVVWDDAESFSLPVQRLQGLCSKCISAVTFEHR